jgi:hypothetical protein
MRHRARRPLLDLFQRLVVAPRAVVLALAVILAGAASAVALGIYDGAQTPTAGASVTEEPETPYDGSEPSLPAETLTGNGPSRSPADEPTTSAPTPSDSPTETRDADDVVSRSAERLPDPVETPEPTQTTVSSEPSPTPNSPETTATTRQANANRWTVSVSADEDATFECSLDGGGYSPCETTVTYRDLDEGTHTFAARATDGDGNTDPSPAQLSTEVTAPGEG